MGKPVNKVTVIGQKFNKLTTKKFIGQERNANSFEFECECGNIIVRRFTVVKRGICKSCTSCVGKDIRDKKVSDCVGKKFGEWLILSLADSDIYSNTRFLCRCRCGIERVLCYSSLKTGATTSCRPCHFKIIYEKSLIHGLWNHPTYLYWNGIKNRKKYHDFFPEEWFDFVKFREDVGDKPSYHHDLSRINNLEKYSYDNHHWVPKKKEK